MPDYSQGKIYMIEPTCKHDEGDVYIGSTCSKYLSSRLVQHKGRYVAGTLRSNSKILFEKYGVSNCRIYLLEKVPATCREDLIQRECYYVKKIPSVNGVIPC